MLNFKLKAKGHERTCLYFDQREKHQGCHQLKSGNTVLMYKVSTDNLLYSLNFGVDIMGTWKERRKGERSID